MRKRILSLLLCIVLCLSVLPMSAFAAAKLETPSNLHWDGSKALWDKVENASNDYRVTLYKNGTELFHGLAGHNYGRQFDTSMAEYGEGEYTFTVTALAKEGSDFIDSDESSMSPVFFFTDKMDTPTGLKWDNYFATWDAVADATTYEATLLKNGESCGCVTSSTCVADLSELITHNGSGTYTFSVVAYGPKLESNPAESPSKTINITPLPAPANLHWEGTKALWDKVENASNDYRVTLYKNGTELFHGLAGHNYGRQFDTSIAEYGEGEYTFTVQALPKKGQIEYGEGIVSPHSPIYSTYPSGTVKISFDANGGSVTPDSAETGTNGKLASLPTPTRSGYSFDGWYTMKEGGTKVDTNTVFTAAATIYAHWSRSFSFADLPETGVTSITVPQGDYFTEQDAKEAFILYWGENIKTDGEFVLIDYFDVDANGYHMWEVIVENDVISVMDSGYANLAGILFAVNNPNQIYDWWINGTYTADTAVTEYDVWVSGTQVTSANKDNILDDSGTPTATYDPDTKTLTLNNATITNVHSDDSINAAVYSGETLTVVLKGSNTVSPASSVDAFGFYSDSGNLTLTGSGDVDIESYYAGIYANAGNITLSNSGDVTIEAEDDDGIYADMNVTVSGDGELTVKSYYCGIFAEDGSITISGGGNRTFYSTGGTDKRHSAVDSYKGDIDVSGTGKLTIASEPSASAEYYIGLYSYDGSLSVSGSVVLDISDVNIGTYSEDATTFASSGEMTVDASVWGVSSNDDIIFYGTGKATISGGEYGAYLFDSGKSVLLNGTGAPISLTAGEGYKAVWNDADSSSPVGGTNIANYDVTGAPNEQSVVYTLKCSHTPVTITGKVATCTEDGWKDYYECSLCHKYFEDNACEAEIADLDVWKAAGGNGYIAPKGHTYGEWATTKEPTLTEKGMKERSCTACGDKQTEEIPVLTPATYSIISGANGEWTKGSTTGLAFTSDAPFDKFDSVKIDDSTIAVTNYTAEEGSTKITLTPAYLETLNVGSHSIVVVSTDGTASTNFTVKSAEQPPVVPTNYTVTFNMNGHGTQITGQTVEDGGKATKPANPTASGYTFKGWYTDSTFQTAFDFDTAIHADTTLYAKWVTNSVTPTATNNPKTGDNSNMLLWVLLLAASGAALTGTAIYSRKRKHN